jgi:diguanylate cyclase (GGDEF)-like protein
LASRAPACWVPAAPAVTRSEARVRAFRLIEELQSGSAEAPAELEVLTARAESEGWGEVVRAGLFGRAVAAWIGRQEDLPEAVALLVERATADGDATMTALGLAMDSMGEGHGGSVDQDNLLARAAALLEHNDGGALEKISAHTACGIAFGNRWLWELGDEQYATALAIGDAEPPGTVDFVLAPVVFNRLEVQVAWASTLAQLGDDAGIAERWRLWNEASRQEAAIAAMPSEWRNELLTLGLLLAAIAGIETVDGAERPALLETEELSPRASGHLALASALTKCSSEPAGAAAAAELALALIDPSSHPHEYDLALFVAARLEAAAAAPQGAGLRYARRHLEQHWAGRLAALGAMRSRVNAERLAAELDSVNRRAHLDDLTGAGNRRALERYLSDAERRDVPAVAVLMTDLDNFKSVNDRHGHVVGDNVLRQFARITESVIRSSDIAVRLGGDEFMIVLADADLGVARQRAADIVNRVAAAPWSDLSPGLSIQVSVGVAVGDPGDLDELIRLADAALYDAKRRGGSSVVAH